MSSVAVVAPPAAIRPAINPWIVAAAVIIPTFMEVLDTTVAIVSLRYIAGDLSAAVVDAEWVLTCYLAANATILPISGWLSARLGRRNYFLLSIGVFTIASALCGMATSLWQIILFRIIQGLAGGGLQPSSQAILIDSFPPEKQGTAMTMFGIAALTAPVVGPTLGGYLSDYQTGAGSSISTSPSAASRFCYRTSSSRIRIISSRNVPGCGECRSISTTSAWRSWRWSCAHGKC